MAFFAESTVNESYNNLGIVVNENTDFDTLALEACVTIQEMDNAIMNGIGRYELDQLRESGEVVYTEGMLESIKDKISKIWNFIKKWVKSVWGKFIAWLYPIFRSDKAFVTKYEKKIKENVIHLDKDYEYTMKYGKLFSDGNIEPKPKKNIETMHNEARESIRRGALTDNYKEDIEKALEKFDEDAEDFKDFLKDEDFEQTFTASNIGSEITAIITSLKEDPSKLKKIGDVMDKMVNDLSKKYINNATTKNSSINQTASLNAYKSLVSKTSSLITHHTNFIIKATKSIKSDCRAICRKILTAKPNPKYNESAFEHKDFESYFNI